MNESPIIPAGADPDEADRGRDRRRGAAGLALAGLVAGLLLGGLFGRVEGPAIPTTSPESEPVAPPPSLTTTTARAREVSRLATLVPGLVHGLAIVTPADLGGHRVWVWEASAEGATPRPLPGGEIANDLGATWLSSLTPSRFTIGNALWIGDDDRMDPAATNVIWATWSRTTPARVIWSEVTSTAETVLVEAEFREQAQPQRAAIARIPPGSYPVWWTDRGVVVTTTRELTAIDPSGGVVAQMEAAFLGGGIAYGVVMPDDGPGRFVTVDLDPVGPVPWGPECGTVAFSPLATDVLAVVCGDGEGARLEVWAGGGSGVMDLEPVVTVPGVDAILPAWSPDGRFVVTAVTDRFRPRSDLVFVELETRTPITVPFRAQVLGLAFTRN